MQVAKASEISRIVPWFTDTDYYVTKGGTKVSNKVGNLALQFQTAQLSLAKVQEKIDGLLGHQFIQLEWDINKIPHESNPNEKYPIWQKHEELEKLLKECSLLDRGKLYEASKLCNELQEMLNPEIDLIHGKFIIASKGKQYVEIPDGKKS